MRRAAIVAPVMAVVSGSTFACGTSQPTSEAPIEAASTELLSATVAPGASAAHHEPIAPCPLGMVLAEGEYCPDVEHTCLEWMDPPESRYAHFRCARYAKPAKCKKPKVHVRFCIDVRERTEDGGELPARYQSFTSSAALCKAAGARLCRESEWQFACEGEEMRPYPYGWERDATVCNTDISTGLGKTGRLADHRTPASAHPRCASPFGVLDMSGNMEEWVVDETAPVGLREAMKGSWWIPSRHACRSRQVGHGASYGGRETGTRCCRDL